MSDKQNPTQTPDTGHVWDGNLRELTNQPPKWWMNTLYLSGIFVVIYFILYPSIPLLNGWTKGILGWTQMKRLNETMAEIEEIRAPYENKLKGMSAAAILADEELSNYVVASAKVLFGDRCAPCHGTGGAGNPGFPVLADDDWLYGGSIDSIQQSISNGRKGMMPGFGAMLSEQQLDDLSKHVVAMSKGEEYAPGKELFVSQGCIGCHGMDGKGIQMMGSANLTDAIWRFAPGGEESVKYTIRYGVNSGAEGARNAVMPSFKDKLTETEIKKLAVYVYKLGGGQ
ncbi:MAG TPA: cytochrome-c oxidase, cbb3-type subunit III [Gammaproteobacteria bacterium]|nr:cytochrome-c oxidase, cbb3-type subunit III [Gammaproteobacteria bacterium]